MTFKCPRCDTEGESTYEGEKATGARCPNISCDVIFFSSDGRILDRRIDAEVMKDLIIRFSPSGEIKWRCPNCSLFHEAVKVEMGVTLAEVMRRSWKEAQEGNPGVIMTNVSGPTNEEQILLTTADDEKLWIPSTDFLKVLTQLPSDYGLAVAKRWS